MSCSVTLEKINNHLTQLSTQSLVDSSLFNNDLSLTHPLLVNIPYSQKKGMTDDEYLKDLFNSDDKFNKDIYLKGWENSYDVYDVPQFREAIQKVNDEYKYNIAGKDINGKFSINIPLEVQERYILASKDGQQYAKDKIREHYINEFNDNSENLLTIDNYLDHPFVNEPSVRSLLEFAKRLNPDIKIAVTDNLDKNAVSIISKGLILIKGNNLNSLSEELSHFLYELLPVNHPLKQKLDDIVIQTSLYQSVVKDYSKLSEYQNENGTPDYNKIKAEASAKLLSEYVQNAANGTAQNKYKSIYQKLKSLISDIFNFFRSGFTSVKKETPAGFQELFDTMNVFNKEWNLDFSQYGNSSDIFFNAISPLPSVDLFEADDNIKEIKDFTNSIRTVIGNNLNSNLKLTNNEAINTVIKDIYDKSALNTDDIMRQVSKVFPWLTNPDASDEQNQINAINELVTTYTLLHKIPESISLFRSDFVKKLESSDFMKVSVDGSPAVFNYTNYKGDELQFSAKEIIQLWASFSNIIDKYELMVESFKKLGTDIGTLQIGDDIIDVSDKIEKSLTQYNTSISDTKSTLDRISKLAVIRYLYDNMSESMAQLKKLTDQRVQDFRDAGNTDEQWIREYIAKQNEAQIQTAEDIRAIIEGRSVKGLMDTGSMDVVQYYTGSFANLKDWILVSPMNDYLIEMFQAENLTNQMQAEALRMLTDLNIPMTQYISEMKKIQEWVKVDINGKEKDKLRIITKYDDIQFYKDVAKMEEAIFEEKDREKKRELQQQLYQYKLENQHSEFIDSYHQKQSRIKELTKIINTNKNGDIQDVLDKYIKDEEKMIVMSQDDTMDFEELTILQTNITKQALDLIKKTDKLPQNIIDAIAERSDLFKELRERNEVKSNSRFESMRTIWVENQYNTNYSNSDPRQEAAIKLKLENLYNNRHQTDDTTDAYKALVAREFGNNEEKHRIVDPNLLVIQKESYREKNRIDKILKLANGELMSSILLYDTTLLDEYNKHFNLLKDTNKLVSNQYLYLNELNKLEAGLINDNILRYINGIVKLYIEDLSSTLLEKIGTSEYGEDAIFSYMFDMSDKDKESLKNAFIEYNKQPVKNLSIIANVINTFKPNSIKFGDYTLKLTINKQEAVRDGQIVNLGNSDIKNAEILISRAVLKNQNSFNSISKEKDILLSSDYLTTVVAKITDMFSFAKQNYELFKDKYDNLNLGVDFRGDFGKYENRLADVTDVASAEELFADSDFRTMLQIISDDFQEITGYDESTIEATQTFVDNFLKTHKLINVEGITTSKVPAIFTKTLPSNPAYRTKKYSQMFNVTEIKKEFYLPDDQKYDYSHPDVLSGDKDANIDMQGNFLPKSDKYLNPLFNSIKDSAIYKLASRLFFQSQLLITNKKSRHNTIVPSRFKDHWESASDITGIPARMRDWFTSLKENNSRAMDTGVADREEDVIERGQGYSTTNNKYYTDTVKMATKTSVIKESQSLDLFAGVMHMIDDINKANVKRTIAPIFEGMHSVIENSSSKIKANQKRLSILKMFLDNHMYDKASDDFLSRSTMGKAISQALSIASRTLLADFIGGTVSFFSNEGQLLLRTVNIADKGSSEKIKNGSIAFAESFKYLKNVEWENANTKGKYSAGTQLLWILGAFPNGTHIEENTYGLKKIVGSPSTLFIPRELLMTPRRLPEDFTGIHMALTIAKGIKIKDKTGKEYSLDKIYDLDNKGVIKLIDAFKDDEQVQKDYNPVNGRKLFESRLHILRESTKILGNNARITSPQLSKVVWGKPIVFMKKWLFDPLLVTRFGKRHFNLQSRNSEEGNYMTAIRVGYEMMKYLYKGEFTNYWTQLKTNNDDKRNLKKAGIEMAFIAITFLLIGLTGFDSDDPDKWDKLAEKDELQQYLILVTMRLNQEMSTYTPIPAKMFGGSELLATFVDPWRPVRKTFGKYANLVSLGGSEIGHFFGADNDKDIFYQKKGGHWFDEKGDRKIMAAFYKLIGGSGDINNPIPKIKLLDRPQQNN